MAKKNKGSSGRSRGIKVGGSLLRKGSAAAARSAATKAKKGSKSNAEGASEPKGAKRAGPKQGDKQLKSPGFRSAGKAKKRKPAAVKLVPSGVSAISKLSSRAVLLLRMPLSTVPHYIVSMVLLMSLTTTRKARRSRQCEQSTQL
jgi:hypothetical protein